MGLRRKGRGMRGGRRMTAEQVREFNERFAIIEGFAQMLIEGEPPTADHAARRALEAIRRNAAHAKALVNFEAADWAEGSRQGRPSLTSEDAH